MPTYSVDASLKVTAAQPASTSIPLRYVGKTPVITQVSNQSNDIAYKGHSDRFYNTVSVTQDWVDSKVNQYRSNKLLWSDFLTEINKSDGGNPPNRLYPTKSEVTTDQARYISSALLGAPATGQNGQNPGVAKSDGNGFLLSGVPVGTTNHVPSGIRTDNLTAMYDARYSGTMFLTSNRAVTGNAITDYLAGTFTVPNPGYAYVPLNFVWIQGYASGSQGNFLTGTSNFGTVAVTNDVGTGQQPVIYAQGSCIDRPRWNYHIALPNTARTNAPSRAPAAVTGDLKLCLYLSNASGSNYTFSPSGLVWIVVIMPVVGN
jgi:hypothetical protein